MYRHEQTTPSDTWVITHGLYTYPVVDVYVSADGQLQKILPEAVTYTSSTVVTISFSEPRTGFATVA